MSATAPRLLGKGDRIEFVAGGQAVPIGCRIPIFRSDKKDQRVPLPNGQAIPWPEIKAELAASRAGVFRVEARDGGHWIRILTGRLLLDCNTRSSKERPGFILWVNAIRFASGFERRQMLGSGLGLSHMGFLLGTPREVWPDLHRYNQQAEQLVGAVLSAAATAAVQTKLENPDVELDEPVDEEGALLRSELVESLQMIIDAEHELEEREAQSQGGFAYFSVSGEAGRNRFKTTVRFSLIESDGKRLEKDGSTIQTLSIRDQYDNEIVVGVVGLEKKDGAYVLVGTITDQRGLEALPQSGELNRMILDVQKKVRHAAVDSLRSRKSSNRWLIPVAAGSADLPEYVEGSLDGLESAARLNPSQKKAVAKGLGSPDLQLVLGPPGTGKTTVILNWVESLVREGKRVLVTSQNNKAVDNVLERLKRDEAFTCVRLGDESKVSGSVVDLLIDNRAVGLQKQLLASVEAGQRALDECLAVLARSAQSIQADSDDSQAQLEDLADRLGRAETMLGELAGKTHADSIARAISESATLDEKVRSEKEKVADLQARSGFFGWFHKTRAIWHRAKSKRLSSRLAKQRGSLLGTLGAASTNAASIQSVASRWKESLENARQEDLYPLLLQLVDVVGATCIGINTKKLFKDVEFDMTIVDESGQIQLHNLVVPLSRSPRAILVGDHKQLPPVVKDEVAEEVRLRGESTTFDVKEELIRASWFEQAWDILPDSRKSALDTQFRCPSVISDFISDAFYDGGYFAGEAMKGKSSIVSFFRSPMVFVDTSDVESSMRIEKTSSGSDRVEVLDNPYETELIALLVRRLCEVLPDTAAEGEIGIIVPYKNHVRAIQRRIERDRKAGLLPNLATPPNDLVASVDSYQGQERDIILFAFSRSNPRGTVGFLADWRRLNVAMTRTKKQLIMVGDLTTLTRSGRAGSRDSEFKESMKVLSRHMESVGHLVPSRSLEGLMRGN